MDGAMNEHRVCAALINWSEPTTERHDRFCLVHYLAYVGIIIERNTLLRSAAHDKRQNGPAGQTTSSGHTIERPKTHYYTSCL